MIFYNWFGAENGAEYEGCSEADDRKIVWYDNLLGDELPDLSDWVIPNLRQYRGENGRRKFRPILDAPSSAAVNLVSANAALALDDIWSRHADLYPVRLEDAPDKKYYMVVATKEIDCLDRDISSGALQKYGPTPELFASVHTWVFEEEKVGDVDLFTIPDSRTNIFVSDRFKKRLLEAGLSGFCLRKSFWDEDPWIS